VDLKVAGCKSVDYIHVAQDRIQDHVNTTVNLRVP